MTEFPMLFSDPMVQAIDAGRKTQTRRILKLPKWLDKYHGGPTGWPEPEYLEAGGHFPDLAWGATACLKVRCKDGTLHRIRNPWSWSSNKHVATDDQDIRLWVRQAWRAGVPQLPVWRASTIHYRADESVRDIWEIGSPEILTRWFEQTRDFNGHQWIGWLDRWRPSIFMPRWASRLSLQVTGVRAERLQDITEEDARVEGCGLVQVDGLPDDLKDWGTDQVINNNRRALFTHLWDSINGGKPGCSWADSPWVWVVTFEPIA